MFNIGGGEMVVIFLLALLVLGPERLPKAMGQVGRAVAQMRKLSSGFQDEIRRAMDPIEAPFRPGEETLSGPMPSITDEVRVVSTADDGADAADAGDREGPSAPAVELGKVLGDGAADPLVVEPATEAVVVEPEAESGTVTPLRPRLQDGEGGDGGDRATG